MVKSTHRRRPPQTAPPPLPVLQRSLVPVRRDQEGWRCFQRFVPKSENVEIDFVPLEQVVVGEIFEPVAFFAFVAVSRHESIGRTRPDQRVSAFSPFKVKC